VSNTSIHPNAVIDPSAVLGDDVVIDHGAFVGPNCVVGAGTHLRPYSVLVENFTLGEHNEVHEYAVLGGDPQDRKFDRAKDVGSLVIGDRNIFREHVSVNRGCGGAGPTTIGDNVFFMAGSHAGHNVKVADDVVLANCVMLAGHVRVGKGTFIGGGAGVHQFVIVGDRVMMQGHASITMHVPHYVMAAQSNDIYGLNRVGLRRCGEFTREEIMEVKDAFRVAFSEGAVDKRGVLDRALERDWGKPALAFLTFCRAALDMEAPYNRGLVSPSRAMRERALAD
jgi:UDP-N-acetylglucosamine acyltransferase